MCSFLLTRTLDPVSDAAIAISNVFSVRRGPDRTQHVRLIDPSGLHWSLLHNLLDISGHAAVQPVVQGQDDHILGLLFNGELYNFDHGAFRTDTESLIPAYLRHGDRLAATLDGEFAIVIADLRRGQVMICTDAFMTKPVFLACRRETGEFGIASYASSLEAIGFGDIQMLAPNSVCTIQFGAASVSVTAHGEVTSYDLRQWKSSYDDWVEAFLESVRQRATHGSHRPFVCLSSGYDSGAICLALNELGIEYETISIRAGESLDILDARIRANEQHGCRRAHIIRGVPPRRARELSADIVKNVEPFLYSHEERPGMRLHLQTDSGAIGVNAVGQLANAHGLKVNLSGSGADEITSDYGFGGRKIFGHSEFGGLFPEQLEGFFPWKKFYGDTQRSYLFKDEFIFGRHGIEGRYPFLDRRVVQEFLSVKVELKNAEYKAPIAHFLRTRGYPFEPGAKRGFFPFEPSPFERLRTRARALVSRKG